MNAMNRGSLRAIALTLEQIRDMLEAMSDCEQNKENGDYQQPPLESKYESSSVKLEEAAIFVNQAIKNIRNIAPNAADFEEWVNDASVPDAECSIEYDE